jgi:hypothetical protein
MKTWMIYFTAYLGSSVREYRPIRSSMVVGGRGSSTESESNRMSEIQSNFYCASHSDWHTNYTIESIEYKFSKMCPSQFFGSKSASCIYPGSLTYLMFSFASGWLGYCSLMRPRWQLFLPSFLQGTRNDPSYLQRQKDPYHDHML